ncbi:MAG: hypothetical protein M3Q07_17340 [Pseudobdellovibrionaceae bacterium]|nr:hypothetical protein [Pseudobdellovibrionaceae bacterium]
MFPLLFLPALLIVAASSFPAIAQTPQISPRASSCLAVATETDIIEYVMAAPFAMRGNKSMRVWETDSKEWQAARNAAVAWAKGDCRAFADAARTMSYEAKLLRDSASDQSYWVLRDNKVRPSHQGVFAFRAPEEMHKARGLVIDAPHMGTDYRFDDSRAVRTFRDTGAVAFLQNTAFRCSLSTTSGCSTVTSIYACGGKEMRDSDVVHSVRHGYYAVYDGIESVRDYMHFEYHGAAGSTNAPGCLGTAHLSQASSTPLSPDEDDGTYPHRLWQALEKQLDPKCARAFGCFTRVRMAP